MKKEIKIFSSKMSFNFTYNYPQVARDSGFKLRNFKDGPLDWHLIGSLEIERILREQSLEQIDGVLNHLSQAPLGPILESNILDSGIAKYFILSQFSVQYLLFCRKFLEETVIDLRESHGVSQMEVATLKRSLSEANNEILQLHKKITQMEAIHEVIYPCHLCTKNFVSNDALNLHISRKHSGIVKKSEKISDTPQVLIKERENDLTLINTIKLELEIKQLKERLNNAEFEIKHNTKEPPLKHVPQNVATAVEAKPEEKEKVSVHSVGIQSNLCEIKEKDDYSEDDLSSSSQSRQQLSMLQDKLQEFEMWKEEQKSQNTEFLTEINSKLVDLSAALESTKNQKQRQLDEEKQKSTSSVEELEILLSKKIEDIGKASAAKLEEVVNKMENNYKEKLDQLENELNKLNKQSVSYQNVECQEKTKVLKGKTLNIIEHNNDSNEKEAKTSVIVQNDDLLEESSVSESNHTFVKNNSETNLEKSKSISYHTKTISKKPSTVSGNHNKSVSSLMSEDDSTDISDSFLDEDNIEYKKNDTSKINNSKERISTVKSAAVKPKKLTKKEAKKLANHRLFALGVDIKTKAIPLALKKRICVELNENRNKAKQKYPHYYATRNKIKKFVDKLCSTKMPDNAEALLKSTKPSRPKIQDEHKEYSENSLSDENDDDAILQTSTPLNINSSTSDSKNFKQRLERILASPIRKPDEHVVRAVVHQQNVMQKPVPMPRKRVMFNHPERLEKRLDHSLSPTESDSQSLERNVNFKKSQSSLGSFI